VSQIIRQVTRLEDAGVIQRYVAVVDPSRIGLPITAMVTMTCDGEQCRQLPARVSPLTEVTACHRLTGDASAILTVVVASIPALERLVDRLAAFGKPSTAVVLSTSFMARPLPTGAPSGASRA